MTKQELRTKFIGQEEILCKLAAQFEHDWRTHDVIIGASVDVQDEAAAHGIRLGTLPIEEYQELR